MIYYPPYHSKYNPIERCWAILENYWNRTIFDSRETTIAWAYNLTWKGNHPTIHLDEYTYEKGITVAAPELSSLQQFWQPSESLPKWDVTIVPP